MEGRKRPRRHDAEFKREGVRLTIIGGPRVADMARDPGITANMLHR